LVISVSSDPACHAPVAPDISLVRDGISRSIDIFVSSAAILFLAPLMLVVAAAIHLLDGGPVLSGQTRVGKDGRTYRCWRFRSASLPHPAAARWQNVRPEQGERTPLGALLRQLGVDELPQLLNILNGDMSLVGPRPVKAEDADRYGRYLAEYCSVRPGLTGLWQVSPLSAMSRRRQVAVDITYIRSKSLGLDLRILFLILSRPLVSVA